MEKDVKKRFDEASKQYTTDSFVERDQSARLVSQLAAPNANDIILDLGCGPGKQIIELSHHIKWGIGIDISEGMLQQATQNATLQNSMNTEFHLGTFLHPDQNSNWREKHITKIISNYALHHLTLPEKQQAIEKMVEIGGESLQTIVIGDLMYFENPESIGDVFAATGFVPGIDIPSTVNELMECFTQLSFTVQAHKLHAVVGVLVATKKK